MRSINILFCLLIFTFEIALADPFDPKAEIFVGNLTSYPVYINFYPIGTIFSGDPNRVSNDTTYYDLHQTVSPSSPFPRRGGGPDLRYLMGLDGFALSIAQNADTGFFKVDPFSGNEWSNF